MSTHTLAILVENEPGAFARLSGLFARRGFNIGAIAASDTEDPRISRVTLVVDTDTAPLEQITKQLNNLVNVIKVVELGQNHAVNRSLMLVKVAANDSNRGNVLQVVDVFRAHVVDVVPDALTIEVTGDQTKTEAFLTAMQPYGIKEIVQSGTVAIGRGARSLTEKLSQELEQRR